MESFELWEQRSGNLVGSFPTEQDALRVVLNTVKGHGSLQIDSILLTQETGTTSTDIAEGKDLVERALNFFYTDHPNTT